MTYPGVPSVLYGDEVGLEGAWGEDARRTMPWDEKWDVEFLDNVKALIKLRKNAPALIEGGLRWVDVDDDYLLYLRESKKQSLLVLVARDTCTVNIDLTRYGYKVSKTLFGPEQKGSAIKLKLAKCPSGFKKVST